MIYKINNPKEFRTNVVTKLDKIINNFKRSCNLEIGIFNYCIHEATKQNILKKWSNNAFVLLYFNKLKSVYLNLTPYVLNLINTGIVKTRHVADMTFYDLNPIKWKPLLDTKDLRDKYKYDNNFKPKISSLFTCRKCHSNNCSYQCIQIRSADEPITTFISCNNCGNNWKMN